MLQCRHPCPALQKVPRIYPEDEEDKKPVIDPLSRLKAFRFPIQTQVPSQNFIHESSKLIERVKKLLISELASPNNITMDVNTMIDRVNGAFDTLAYLQDNDVAFYNTVRSFVRWYHEWVVSDGLRNEISMEIADQYGKLDIELKKAQEAVQEADSNLSMEKNKGVLIRENIRKLEQELVHGEARVITLAVEKEKCEQVLFRVNVDVKVVAAKAKETLMSKGSG